MGCNICGGLSSHAALQASHGGEESVLLGENDLGVALLVDGGAPPVIVQRSECIRAYTRQTDQDSPTGNSWRAAYLS